MFHFMKLTMPDLMLRRPEPARRESIPGVKMTSQRVTKNEYR